MRVSEYLKDYADPRGDISDVAPGDAERVAKELRDLLSNEELWEEQRCEQIATKDIELSANQSLMIAAFGVLHAWERRAWREYVAMGRKCS